MLTPTVRPILLAAACFVAFASPHTARADDVNKVRVAAADLDLQNPADIATLHQRVVHAAVQVCGRPDGFAIADLSRVWNCRKAAVDGATPSLNALVASATQGGVGDQATAKAAP